MAQQRNRAAAKKAPAFHGVKPAWAAWRGSSVGRRIRFIESFCTIPTGHNAGNRMKLAGYQRNVVEEFFADGVRYGLESLPRGNAKSTTMAALGLAELFLNPHSPSVPIVAVTLNQANRAVYRVALRMRELSDELAGRSHVYSAIGSQRLTVPGTDGELFPISADIDGLQGLNPSLALLDEAGFVPLEAFDALKLASGKRPDSLVVGFGTPSFDRTSALGTLRTMLRSGADLPGFRFIEFAADEGCSVHDRRQWHRANPALAAGILSEDVLALDVATTGEAAFRAYRLGQWVDGLASWLGDRASEVWSACLSPWNLIPDAPTWAAVDMALHHDSAAVVVGQRRPDGRLHAVALIWYPHNGLLDAADVMQHLRGLSARYQLEAVTFDPRYFDLPARMLEDEGLAMVEEPQSLERMTPAVAGCFEAIVHGGLTHDGDDAFTEQVLNAVARYNEHGFTLSKPKSRSKIDAAVALAMMHRAASRAAAQPPPAEFKPLFAFS